MRVDLGVLLPALRGWTLCIDEPGCDCMVCVQLPEWAGKFSEREKVYLALFLAAKHLLDYRVAAALHVYMVKNRVALRPELLTRTLREAKVVSRIPRAVEEDSAYVWEAVLYKGVVYAEQVLSLDKRVIVKVEPPKDKLERERLRVMLEGKRVTLKGRTYNVGGLVKKLGGERISPWVYLVPRRSLPRLLANIREKARATMITT
ncbi:MAG: hypothetical protein GSR85_00750 [Desulfurococcales archaeon]|nr:hypothetical protein [Desulfurococcales archaeon]